MSERITTKDVEGLFESVRKLASDAGVTEAENWRIDKGSKTYGRAWRVWLWKDDGTYAHYSAALGTDYLGMTARETYASLQQLRSAFLAVIWAKDAK